MTIIVIVFFIFLLIPSKPFKKNTEYLSKDHTNIIKGFFLLFVFLSHAMQYKLSFSNLWIDKLGMTFVSKLGQLMVTMFLFYSGYGVMESIKRKGKEYVDNIPKKRILITWLNFAVIVLIYMLVSQYFVLHNFSLKKLILSLIGWDSFGNSNWYIFSILILYFITYLSAKSFKERKHIVLSVFIGTVLFALIMRMYKETWWYNTAFCYALGIAFSAYKDEIENWLDGKELLCIVYLVTLFKIVSTYKTNIIWYFIYTIIFTLIIIVITRRIQMKNIILRWIGKNLFPMYIFQRIPMMLLNKYEYMKNNPYVFLMIAFASTVALTLVYNLIIYIIRKIKLKVRHE